MGTALATALGTTFRDTDHDVEAEAGCSVADLFVTHGEPHFRALEERAVARALAEHTGVLALGGGAVTSDGDPPAAGRARGATASSWSGWTSTCASAARRVGLSRDRPILGVNPRAMLRHMLATRAPLYGEVATMTVHTGDREPADVVAEVLAALPGRPVAP